MLKIFLSDLYPGEDEYIFSNASILDFIPQNDLSGVADGNKIYNFSCPYPTKKKIVKLVQQFLNLQIKSTEL